MQLNVPNGPQAPQNPSVVQWSHCKYYNVDQRGQKSGDLYNPDGNPQVSALTLVFVRKVQISPQEEILCR